MKMFKFIFLVLVLNIYCTLSLAQSKNGFDLQGSLIPVQQILAGGPARDGIPSIDQPKFVLADKAGYLQDDSPVLGINYQGVTKAYPINILNWHEIVNDQFNQQPVVITFCPLCGSGMAFSALINGKAHSFGVSGLLYNSDVLLYDRQTQSLWSQLMTQSISGPHKGKRLLSLPVQHTAWLDWKTQYPDTLVLSTDTGYRRNYKNSPYAKYLDSPQTMFPLSSVSRRYHPKEEVLGIEIASHYKVYPFLELEKSPAEFTEIVNGQSITIRYDRKYRSATVFDQQGKQLAGVRTFWFAWYAFHPETEVYVASKSQ
ncbi:MAG: DUF3179 domain-containing protein [Methylococcales bacterium]|nr:DUF3179 domain-containing protein [Methylococcales bacterium]